MAATSSKGTGFNGGRILTIPARSGLEWVSAATISAMAYLRDIKDFSAMNEVWDAWVPQGCAPARACVEARLAREDLLVEVSITAALKE